MNMIDNIAFETTHPSQQETNKQINKAPFTYVRTLDEKQAAYSEWRVSPVDNSDKPNPLKTDEEIIESVRSQREGREWVLDDYWKNKGQPTEQIELQINGTQITIYNWNKDKPFTDEHIRRVQKAFKELASRFPKILEQVRYILIDDKQKPKSARGDEEKYPLNGYADINWHAFELLPRGMELIPHRVAATTNFEGTLVHELTHLIQSTFKKDWDQKFQWDWCDDHLNYWGSRVTSDGKKQSWFNKESGEIAPEGRYPLQPNQCITNYAKINPDEDICESMVAYIFDPEALKKVSPNKFAILESHDGKKTVEGITAKRVSENDIKLPEIKPEVVTYYIEEPKS